MAWLGHIQYYYVLNQVLFTARDSRPTSYFCTNCNVQNNVIDRFI